jgi:chemotaxis protein MotA
MKISTLFGILFGTLAIFGAFLLEGGTMAALLNVPALIIVVGGTFAAGLAGASFSQIARIPRLVFIAFFPKYTDLSKIIEQITQFAHIARREGILGLERKIEEVDHPFLRKLFRICVDGADPQSLLETAETDIEFMAERHLLNSSLFTKLGGYSPTMGIIGTVMGLISTLAAAGGGDPSILIQHIASAFIATMWGIFLANIVWLPLADKLKMLHIEEVQLMRVMIMGVHAVQLGETPTVVRAKLISALPVKEQEGALNLPMNFAANQTAPEQPGGGIFP